MKTLITNWLLASLAMAAHAQSTETGLKIKVHIYNYAGVAPEALARAQQETERIYRQLGIEMEWQICPRTAERNAACEGPGAPTKFILRLSSNEMARSFQLGETIFGFALLSDDGGFGVTATVFAGRAQEMAVDEETRGALLGHLIAHELGHLLLGERGHSAGAGIMRIPWRTKELEQAKKGTMLFLPSQAGKIRTQVVARMLSSANPPGR